MHKSTVRDSIIRGGVGSLLVIIAMFFAGCGLQENFGESVQLANELYSECDCETAEVGLAYKNAEQSVEVTLTDCAIFDNDLNSDATKKLTTSIAKRAAEIYAGSSEYDNVRVEIVRGSHTHVFVHEWDSLIPPPDNTASTDSLSERQQ